KHYKATTRAKILITHLEGTDTVIVNQKNPSIPGWTKVATVYLREGLRQPVIRLVTDAPDGAYVFGDAAAVLINRHRSFEGDPAAIQPMTPDQILPDSPCLLSTWPNPFNSVLNIRVNLPERGWYSLSLWDISGREVMHIREAFMDQGSFQIRVDCQNLSSGIYFLTLKGPGLYTSRKILLLK
ncbi:MAG: hypothetical protein XE04_1790, partial [Marinimicrobia bacterium 46_43]